jgi:hypothetical protein
MPAKKETETAKPSTPDEPKPAVKVESPEMILLKSLSNRLSKLEGDFERLTKSHGFVF